MRATYVRCDILEPAGKHVNARQLVVQPQEPRLPHVSSASMKTVNSNFLKEQAERCRRLAQQADPHTKERLLKLAEEYDRRHKEAAARNLGKD